MSVVDQWVLLSECHWFLVIYQRSLDWCSFWCTWNLWSVESWYLFPKLISHEWVERFCISIREWLTSWRIKREGGSKSQLSRLYFFSFKNCFRRTRGKYDKTKIYNLKRWFYMIHHISKQRQQLRFYLRVIVSNSEISHYYYFFKVSRFFKCVCVHSFSLALEFFFTTFFYLYPLLSNRLTSHLFMAFLHIVYLQPVSPLTFYTILSVSRLGIWSCVISYLFVTGASTTIRVLF